MRGAEGTATFLPGISLKDAWSKPLKNYVRNVEAVGSNPITSTDESPGQRTEGGSSP